MSRFSRREKALIYLCLFLSLICAMVVITGKATTFEDVYDDASTFDNVAVAQSVIVNGTNWSLNNSALIPPSFDNFNDYTAISAGGALSRNSSHLVFNGNFRYVTDEYAYISRTLNNEWVIDTSYIVVSLDNSGSTGRQTILMMSNTTADYRWLHANSVTAFHVMTMSKSNANKFYFALQYTIGGSQTTNRTADNILDINTWYYLRLEKDATKVKFSVFSDEARTTLVADISFLLTSFDNTFTKVWAVSNVGYATSLDISGYMKNMLTNQEMQPPIEGYVYTNALITGKDVMVLTYQHKLTGGSEIGISFSDDNITWVNQQNFASGEETEGTGWQALTWEKLGLTTAYIRFRFSRPSPTDDCELRQWRLIYQSTIAPTITLVNGSWIEYNVTSVSVIKGTYVSGNLESMAFDDVDYYHVNEALGIEGYDVRFNFTNVMNTSISLSHRILSEYEGNPAHDVDVEIWNFTGNAWVDSVHVTEHALRWNNNSMSLRSIDFNNNGNVWLRIVHHTSGVNTHYLNVDYLRLRAFIPVYVPSIGGGGGLIWWLGAIFISIPVLLILSYVLGRK